MSPRRRFWRRALAALGVLAVLGSGGVWLVGDALTKTTNSDVPLPPPPARVVHIDSTDGVRLAASWWPAPAKAPAVLLLHGNGSNRGAMSGAGAWLNAEGYAVLAIDFRGHGQSTPAGKSFGLNEADDARAALDWLRARHPGTRVGIIGFSLGGAASLLGRNGPLPVDALVLEGVYPDIRHAIYNRLASRLGTGLATVVEPLLSYQSWPRFGVAPSAIAPIRALARVREPVLVVGGGADVNTPPAETRAMADAARGHATLRILPGVSHDGLGSVMSEDYRRVLLAFLDRNLKG